MFGAGARAGRAYVGREQEVSMAEARRDEYEKQRAAEPHIDDDAGLDGTLGAGGGGSNDVTSGGGAGAGIPDAETAMRMGDTVTRGDVQRDKEKIFPDQRRAAKDERRGT
jgi:hypothetical protein